jgi:D-arabinose 1-dehydrogenase-like Zn-dependent alcohol dehydrogenase
MPRHVDETGPDHGDGRRADRDRTALAGISRISGRKNLSGSAIGGRAETQEMIDFCAENNIVSDVGMLPIPSVNEAFARLLKNGAKYRFTSTWRR